MKAYKCMVAVSALAVTSLLLIGCGTENAENIGAADGEEMTASESTATSESSGETAVSQSQDPRSMNLDSVLGTPGIYRLSSDGDFVVPLNSTANCVLHNADKDLLHGDSLITSSVVEGSSITGEASSMDVYLASEVTTVNKSAGEQIIGINPSETPSVFLWPIVESGYCQEEGIAGSFKDYSEIEGISVENETSDTINDIITQLGISWNIYTHKSSSIGGGTTTYEAFQSKAPITLEAGWYEGTEWHEGRLELTTPYYISLNGAPNDIIPSVPSKDGYISIDLSNVAPGLYLLDSSAPEREVIIEII